MCADEAAGIGVDVRALLPDGVRDNVLRVFGDRGRDWVEALPGVVADLVERWELRLAAPRAYGGGTHSLVLPVIRAGGVPAVLKVPVRDDENRDEAAALRCYAGDGAVLLYEADAESGALLLERLERLARCAALIDHPDREMAIDVACALLRRLRRPPPAGHPFPLVRDLVLRWSEAIPTLWANGDQPLTAPLERETMAALDALGEPDGAEVLVNRDAHLGNIIGAQREPWLLIDPKPLVGEPAFDGGWLLIDLLRAPTPGAAGRLAHRVGAGLGVEPDRVRMWALLRVIENVLWDIQLGADPAESLELAAALAGAT
ncbi:MAG TPA: aminoglycoside phosphotransferase family protein [Candidatus Dormibacteraeota bacterium]